MKRTTSVTLSILGILAIGIILGYSVWDVSRPIDSVKVHVIGEKMDPEDITVFLLSPRRGEGDTAETTVINADGYATFTNVPQGRIKVAVRIKGGKCFYGLAEKTAIISKHREILLFELNTDDCSMTVSFEH